MHSTVKRCSKCGHTKPLDEFHNHKVERTRYKDGKQVHCKMCQKENQLFKKYGMSFKEYQAMIDDHGNKCAICQCELNTSRYTKMNVDHDHRTGAVRGLLCFQCNAALGLMKDSIQRCHAMAAYITLHQTHSEDIV